MASKSFDYDTIKAHNKRDDLWIVIDNKVYDVTEFVNDHPGGSEMFLNYAGKDASEAFENVGHNENDKVKTLMAKYYIGDLKLSLSKSNHSDSTIEEEVEDKQQEKTEESTESQHDLKEDALK